MGERARAVSAWMTRHDGAQAAVAALEGWNTGMRAADPG
jgi:hypothetical protein